MKTHFYQTTPQTEIQFAEFEGSAISQEEAILKFLKEDGGKWHAWMLKNIFNYEITSIRRALFNMEKENKVMKVGFVKGPKGVNVGVYKAT